MGRPYDHVDHYRPRHSASTLRLKRKPTPTPYLNEYDPNHFQTPRRCPGYQPDRGLFPDGYVMIISLIISLAALALIYFTEGGL